MNIGIYFIVNITTNMLYVGSSINLEERFKTHKKQLNGGVHVNSYLQYAWDKYGESNFKFYIIEIVLDRNELLKREQYWLDKTQCYNRNIGYNLCPTAGSNLGRKWDDDYKEKMSNVLKGKIKSEEWQENIKLGIKNSTKKFSNRRDKSRWPHEKGNRCICEDCTQKRNENNENYRLNNKERIAAKMREYYYKRKAAR